MFLQHSGFTACQSASHTLPTNPLQRPPISCLSLLRSSTFACLSMLWSPAISCSTCSKAPIFHFAVAQTYMYHNLGQGPSPSTSTLILACKFWIKTCFGKIIIPVQYMLSLCTKCWSVLMHNVCVCVCVCVGGGGGGGLPVLHEERVTCVRHIFPNAPLSWICVAVGIHIFRV